MKKILITAALLAATTTSAFAFEIGNNFSLDNTTKAKYSVETEKFTASHKLALVYAARDDLDLYVDTTIDLTNAAFAGTNMGLEYAPARLSNATFNLEVQFDKKLKYSDTVLYTEIKF